MSDWVNIETYKKSLIAKASQSENADISLLSSEMGLPDNHRITIREREITVDYTELIQNNVRTDTVTLDLDKEWDGIRPIIIFGDRDDSWGSHAVEYNGEPVHIPAKAMEHIGGLDLSVMGLDSEGLIRLVTKAAPDTFNVVESGEYIGEISEDDASLLAQILQMMSDLTELKQKLEDLIEDGTLGVADYNNMSNKPVIDGVELKGEMTLNTFGLAPLTNEELDEILV